MKKARGARGSRGRGSGRRVPAPDPSRPGTPGSATELLVNELDGTFRDRLAAKVGDVVFMHCLSCGSCTASCPVRRLDEKYNPRRIIRMAILGMKEEVYGSEFVWVCSYHSTCLHRCPQGVNIGAVADAVVRIADERRRDTTEMPEPDRAPNRTINGPHFDRRFKKQVMDKMPELGRCFVCGSCTAVCPETLMDRGKDPRRFLRLVNLGLRDRAFQDEFKDICATHYRCLSRCPQGVQISQIMNAIKELAVEDGYSYPESLAELEKAEKNSG